MYIYQTCISILYSVFTLMLLFIIVESSQGFPQKIPAPLQVQVRSLQTANRISGLYCSNKLLKSGRKLPKSLSASKRLPIASSSSSNLSKFDFFNCAFIPTSFSNEDFEVEYYNLVDIVRYHDVDISGPKKEGDSNKAAGVIIRVMIKSKKIAVKQEHGFIFNDINVDRFINCYASSHNTTDVALVEGKSVLCSIEVHSSPFLYTVRKVTHGLVELLHVVKAHQITQCQMIGFASPRLVCKKSVMKVTVIYDVNRKRFESCYERINDVANIQQELLDAITHNRGLLRECLNSEFNEKANDYVLCMSPEDLKDHGDNAIQMRCNFGILIQAHVEGKLVCIKKPLFTTSFIQLLKIPKSIGVIAGIIEYKDFLRLEDTIYYEKIKYDPLCSEELIQCLYNFILAVVNIIKLLQQKNLVHRDVRVLGRQNKAANILKAQALVQSCLQQLSIYKDRF